MPRLDLSMSRSTGPRSCCKNGLIRHRSRRSCSCRSPRLRAPTKQRKQKVRSVSSTTLLGRCSRLRHQRCQVRGNAAISKRQTVDIRYPSQTFSVTRRPVPPIARPGRRDTMPARRRCRSRLRNRKMTMRRARHRALFSRSPRNRPQSLTRRALPGTSRTHAIARSFHCLCRRLFCRGRLTQRQMLQPNRSVPTRPCRPHPQIRRAGRTARRPFRLGRRVPTTTSTLQYGPRTEPMSRGGRRAFA